MDAKAVQATSAVSWVAVGLADVAASVGVADGLPGGDAVAEAAVDAVAEAAWLTLAAAEAVADELTDAVEAVGVVFDEAAEHPALAKASPAVKSVVP